ncbi:nucleotidyltransferase domain-containing protein [candidate division KSB1 bacterium]|nr:nucleotidyltransferase domain-containing protein [candidate division KSB1 bacterium]
MKRKVNKNEILAYLRDCLPALQADFGITKIGLFGSFARNKQNDKSDIDIILEFKSGTDNIYEKKPRLKNDLEIHFQRPVELCREKYLKPYMRDYLLKEVIYV